MSKTSPFPYKKAVITGATSGLGKALSYALAKKGVNLLLSGRNETVLFAMKQALSSHTLISTQAADLCKEHDQKQFFAAMASFSPDLVIHCAGFGFYGPLLSQPLQTWLDMVELQSKVSLQISFLAAEQWKQSGKEGTVMLISSAAAFHNFPYFSVYSASKAFINRFAQSFDTEMRPYGIRMLTSCPGMINTPFRARASKGATNTSTIWDMKVEDAAQEIIAQILRKERLHIFDFRYRLGNFISYLLPKNWLEYLLGRSVQKRVLKNQSP